MKVLKIVLLIFAFSIFIIGCQSKEVNEVDKTEGIQSAQASIKAKDFGRRCVVVPA